MESNEIRKKFLEFFKTRGHTIVPSASLIPDDLSVLLTTAGMQQFKPYLTGTADPEKVFGAKNIFSIQRCFRTTDIDEVGDASHLTFFEMLGNFSFGGYFKEHAIPLSFEFLTSSDGLGIDPQKLYVTAFKGDDEVPRDDEAVRLWQEQFKSVGMDATIGERIFLYGREKNWWEAGPGPAGPDSEMFYDIGTPHDGAFGPTCHPNCDCGRFIEIGNDVFVQYNRTQDGRYVTLAQKSVDNGRGFERLVMVMQGKRNIFETDLFQPFMELLPSDVPLRVRRIIVDHLRGSVFLLADGIRPSNKDRGYILRRLLRRAFAYEHLHEIPAHVFPAIVHDIIHQFQDAYRELPQQGDDIRNEIMRERGRLEKTMARGIRELASLPILDAANAFRIYESYGLPFEIIKEVGNEKAKDLSREAFDVEFAKHQEISRAGAEKKFGGHGLLLDTGELKAGSEEELAVVTRLHTATHLLNAALHRVLGDTIEQRGSDITVERTRFDFLFGRKLTPPELGEIEDLVNAAIRKNLPVTWAEMPLDEAKKSGALFFSKGQYPERVKVWTIGAGDEVFSRELCAGPHVKRTGEIMSFKIIKEESSAAGIRRIRAVVPRI